MLNISENDNFNKKKNFNFLNYIFLIKGNLKEYVNMKLRDHGMYFLWIYILHVAKGRLPGHAIIIR